MVDNDPPEFPARHLASWSYLLNQGHMRKAGHTWARTTIAKTLKDNGIAPGPNRPTWRTFLESHADVIVTATPFTVDLHSKAD